MNRWYRTSCVQTQQYQPISFHFISDNTISNLCSSTVYDTMKDSYDHYSKIMKDAVVGECYKITMDQLSKKPKSELHISNMNAHELESLKLQDPFMYYSIPSVRRATVLMNEVDSSDLKCSDSSKVTRKSSITFECHPDLLLEDVLWVYDARGGGWCIG